MSTITESMFLAARPPTPGPLVTGEVFSIPLATNRYLIYAPLRRLAFIANDHMVNAIDELRSSSVAGNQESATVAFLKRIGLYSSPEEVDPITRFSGQPYPTNVTLFLTTACNLRCTYCYASAGDTPLKAMPLETAIRGIDFVSANAVEAGQETFEVNFHGGGEPTRNWKILTEAVGYARRRGRQLGLVPKISAATNGVLSPAQTDWIIANLDAVSLSCDGLPSIQDRHRPLASGGGSSGIVMRTMRRFDSASFRYGIRVTVTRDQIPSLPDSIEFLCRKTRPQRIQVEPAYALGRWKAEPSAETAEFIDAYREAQTRARALGREITYSAARVGLLTNHFCGISQDTFSLSPDGNVSACYEVFSEDNTWAKEFFYGSADPHGVGYRFDMAALERLRHQGVEHKEFCRGCYAKWHCAGDCHHKALNVNGGEEFQGSDRCHITRELTKDQILDRIAASGGLFWHGSGEEQHACKADGKETII